MSVCTDSLGDSGKEHEDSRSALVSSSSTCTGVEVATGGAGGAMEGSGGPMGGAGGAMEGSGGAMEGSGGAMERSGGPMGGAGGAMEGSGFAVSDMEGPGGAGDTTGASVDPSRLPNPSLIESAIIFMFWVKLSSNKTCPF